MRLKNLFWEIKNNTKFSAIIIAIFRFGNFVNKKIHIPIIRQFLFIIYKILDWLIIRIICNSEFPPSITIGKRLRVYHPFGIIIQADASIGNDCQMRHQVTIGWAKSSKNGEGPPNLKNNVDIGAGAKIIGNITIGDNVVVGANSLVCNNVEANDVVGGVPARSLKKEIKK